MKRNMYVDDMMKSVTTTDKAIRLAEQLRELLQRGGFRLMKWFSNKREVLASVPESERAKSVVNLEGKQLPTNGIQKMMQFIWSVPRKILKMKEEMVLTRRGMVSAIYSCFDPLGFIAPYVMKAKILLQMLSRKKIGWDDPVTENENAQWKTLARRYSPDYRC